MCSSSFVPQGEMLTSVVSEKLIQYLQDKLVILCWMMHVATAPFCRHSIHHPVDYKTIYFFAVAMISIDAPRVTRSNYQLAHDPLERSRSFHTKISPLCSTKFISSTGTRTSYQTRAATIHRCTGESRYFLSRYEYRYLNGISLYRVYHQK